MVFPVILMCDGAWSHFTCFTQLFDETQQWFPQIPVLDWALGGRPRGGGGGGHMPELMAVRSRRYAGDCF